MCGFCLNTRQLYDAIKKSLRSVGTDIGDSISGFMSKSFTCDKAETNYHKLMCILGTCENACTVDALSDVTRETGNSQVKYYQFERVEVHYINKKNEPAISKQIQRVDYTESLGVISEKLNDLALKYLYHRYLVVNETSAVFGQRSWLLHQMSLLSSTLITQRTYSACQSLSLKATTFLELRWFYIAQLLILLMVTPMFIILQIRLRKITMQPCLSSGTWYRHTISQQQIQ